VIGRYALHDEIAAGGVATVHLGRLLGQAGFSRTVAIKRLHAQFAKDPDFVAMFMDEARLAARIHHPNVVSTLDVVARDGELFVVMEYIPGEALSKLVRCAAATGARIEPRIAVAIVAGFLHGLHAAHEARSERGEPLELVHRDVSPQNVLVGIDGVARVVDFGIAKAVGRTQTTREGQLKGKIAYMAPEQLHGIEVSRRTDIYAASIVLWELLAGKRLFARENDAAVMMAALTEEVPAPSVVAPAVPGRLDRITLRGLARLPEARFATAREMALALEGAIDLALPSEVGSWVQTTAGSILGRRSSLVADIESNSGMDRPLPSDSQPAPPADAKTLMTSAGPDDVSLAPPSDRKDRDNERKRKGLVALLAFAALIAGGALVARVIASPRRLPAAASPSSVTALPPPALSPPPPPMELPTVAPAESASAAPTAPPARAAAPPVAPSTVASPRVAPSKRPATVNCDPPYRVEASGRKIFKIECL
jgi:serine/threonine protein kinase